MAPQRRAAIIGAGIGGLASGIALTRAGWEVTVYEAAEEIRPLGAGLRDALVSRAPEFARLRQFDRVLAPS